jgi:Family of unknown function (DUF6958)
LKESIGMTPEKILTRNPIKGKKGVRIDRATYELVKSATLATFKEKPELTKAELIEGVGRRAKGKLKGTVEWPVMAVKLDLEAKGIVSRVPGTSPILHRLAKRDK